MDQPIGARASLLRTEAVSKEAGMTSSGVELRLTVRDPEVVAELNARPAGEREQFALNALRIGVLALRQAGGAIDMQALQKQGDALIKEFEGKLATHARGLNDKLESELGKYFDPADGHFSERVKSLIGEGGKDGELSRRIKELIGGDNSLLAAQLAQAVGKDSPMMRYLSPEQKDGLIARITAIAEERLEQQGKKLLGEFDLNNPNGALSRLVAQIETNLNPADPTSALGVMNSALKGTQEQIRKDLSLDESTSSLKRLHDGLRVQIDDMLAKQAAFQSAVSQQLGIKQVQARTTEGGFSFEHLAGEALKLRVLALGDSFESVGEIPGELKRKTGDHLQTLGEESAAAGGRVVYECKRDKRYRVKVALDEMEEARKNRKAEVGVFIMAAKTVREAPDLKAEYPPALARVGNDIIAVWDAENPVSDLILDVAVGLARALVVRQKHAAEEDSPEELEDFTRAIADIGKQFERFDKMAKWCDDIGDTAEGLKEELSKVLKRLRADVKSLNEGLDSIGK